MRYSRIISFVNGLMMSGNVIAATVDLPSFSPYVDFTLNTHWEPQSQTMEPMDLSIPAKSIGLKSYHLAFITDSGSCQPAWGGQPDYRVDAQWGKRQTDLLFHNEIQVTVSFGGASGVDLSQQCSISQLVNTFNQISELYHAKALDFDIENGSADVPKLLKALSIFQQQHVTTRLSFTLPVMPEGLTADGKSLVIAAKEAGLRFNVNIMAMDYGPAYNGNMGDYAIEAATNLHQFLTEVYPQEKPDTLWRAIEVTPMIGVNDVAVEQFTLNNADQLKKFGQEKQLGGLSMWSFTRDKPCTDQWASPICSGNNLQKTDYEFSMRFK